MKRITLSIYVLVPLLATMGCASEKSTTSSTTATAATKTTTASAPAVPATPANTATVASEEPFIRATEEVGAHDPVMIKQGNTFYLFTTGRGISVWSSADMKNWKREKPVFASAPEWAVQAIPGFKDNHIWAPDIAFHNGKYYLYYSISAFGKNTSAIGVATNTTLNPQDPAYKWVDHGKVVQSYPGKTNWNAIDPNIITDEKGQAWMSFGSFWGGLQLVKLTPDRLALAEDSQASKVIASRKEALTLETNPPALPGNPADAGGNAIEAPFIFKKNGYYYLFASIDYCCKGAKSDYKMIVGRSKTLQGPYLDKTGKSLSAGGGTILLEGNEKWNGVGHNATYTFNGQDYLIFHGYDAEQNGRPKLRIERLTWDQSQWPVVSMAK